MRAYKELILKWGLFSKPDIGITAREIWVQSHVESYQKLKKKMVLDASLLNTQHYKVRIKGKVEQSRERSNAFHYTLVL